MTPTKENPLEAIWGVAMMQFGEAVVNGEQWALEALKRWKVTGEIPKLVIDGIAPVNKGGVE